MTDSGRPHAKAQESTPATALQQALIEVVKATLAEDGATQADLCRYVGITQKHLSQLLTGKAQGTLELWSRLLHALGIVTVELPIPVRMATHGAWL